MNVLLTGPSGRLGPHLLPAFRDNYQLHTFDLMASTQPSSFVGDLSEIEPLREAMRGCEVVVHLAATSDEAPFVEELVPNNVIGVYNVFEAARLEKVRRVVFASSIHAISHNLRGRDAPLETQDLPHSGSLYGVTKVLGETMGRWYHDKHSLEFIAIRIGAFQPYDSSWLKENRGADIWLSPRDAVSLFRKAIETPGIGYAIVNGTSQTTCERLSLESARAVLGYIPQDDARDFYQNIPA